MIKENMPLVEEIGKIASRLVSCAIDSALNKASEKQKDSTVEISPTKQGGSSR